MLAILRHFADYLRPFRWLALCFLVLAVIEHAVVSLAPLSFQYLIDTAIEPRDQAALIRILAALGAAGAIGVTAGIIGDRLLARINAKVQQRLRYRLFTGMQRMDMERIRSSRTGELVSRFTVDLAAIENALSLMLTLGIQSVIVIAFSVTVLFTLQWSMALAIAAGAILIYIGPALLRKRAQSAFDAYRSGVDEMASDVLDQARGRLTIQGFGLQESASRRFADRLMNLYGSHYRKNAMASSLDRVPMVSMLLVNFTIIGFGSYLAFIGEITIGSLVAFFTIYTSMGNAVYNFTAILPSFTHARVSIDRIAELLKPNERPKAEANKEKAVSTFRRGPEIRADKLAFNYGDDKALLSDVSFTIESGQRVAIVGPSGSGKSTLLQLVLGLRRPGGGRLLIDGTDLAHLNGEQYRGQIGVVFQDNILFRGTLLDNIRLGKPEASFEEAVEAAKQADIHEYISGLPEGYHTWVSEDGGSLSGGQKQRIAIARALLRKPRLLLLDEVTSSLDPISEAAVGRTLGKLPGDCTVVMVTHRLPMIEGFDLILVLNDGKLAECGPHKDLLMKDGLYRTLWEKANPEPLEELASVE